MKQVAFTKFTSTIQWDNLSEIRKLLAVPLKLICGPQRDRGPQFENHWFKTSSLNLRPSFVIIQRMVKY